MYAAAIDRTALNGLFDNQKKLDDLFDSIFDDGDYFITCAPPKTERPVTSHSRSKHQPETIGRLSASLQTIKERHPYFFIVPVILELSVIYGIVTYCL